MESGSSIPSSVLGPLQTAPSTPGGAPGAEVIHPGSAQQWEHSAPAAELHSWVQREAQHRNVQLQEESSETRRDMFSLGSHPLLPAVTQQLSAASPARSRDCSARANRRKEREGTQGG